MDRYATEPCTTFEELFEQARDGAVVLDAARYPPSCSVKGGSVRLTLGPTGAMIVHVEPGSCRCDDFRLEVLFETGSCVFTSAVDLHHFWTGPLAAAFGIEHAAPDEAASDRREEADTDSVATDAPSPPADESLLDHLAPESGGRRMTTRQRQDDHTLTAPLLANELAMVVYGQEAALERVASAVSAQLAKRHPARPGSVLLIGPPGVGKTTTIEALPRALAFLGYERAHVFRLDCGELDDSIQVTRLLGSPPGYVGYAETTPLAHRAREAGLHPARGRVRPCAPGGRRPSPRTPGLGPPDSIHRRRGRRAVCSRGVHDTDRPRRACTDAPARTAGGSLGRAAGVRGAPAREWPPSRRRSADRGVRGLRGAR